MSYNGSMDFGLLGDYDAMHDLEDFGAMVDDSLTELIDAAKKRRGSNGRTKQKPAAQRKPAAKPTSSAKTSQS
jgi:diacylglycerol O-acyltransferase / wax synthase